MGTLERARTRLLHFPQTVNPVTLHFLFGHGPNVPKLLAPELAPVNLNAQNVRVDAQTFRRLTERKHAAP